MSLESWRIFSTLLLALSIGFVHQSVGWLVVQLVHQFVILSSFEVYRQFLHHCPAPQPKCLLTYKTQEEFPYLKPQIYLKYISNPKYPKYISNQSFRALIGPLNPQNNSLKPQIRPHRLQISPRPHVSPLSIHSSSPLRSELSSLKMTPSAPQSALACLKSALSSHISGLSELEPLHFIFFWALPI